MKFKFFIVWTSFTLIFSSIILKSSNTCAQPETGLSISIDKNSQVSLFKDLKVEKNQRYKSVVVIGGNLEFEGEADDVVVLMGDGKLKAGSKVYDDFVVIMGNSMMADGATVNGENVNIEAGNLIKKFLTFVVVPGALISVIALPPLILIIKFILFGVAFGLALLLFHVFPETTFRGKEFLKTKMFQSFLWGLVGLLLIIPLFIFFLISIIGIPLIPFYAIFLFLIFLGGFALSGHYVGRAIPAKIFKENDILALLVGMGIISLVCFVPLVGPIIKFLAITIGIGAVLVALFEPLKKKKANQKNPDQNKDQDKDKD